MLKRVTVAISKYLYNTVFWHILCNPTKDMLKNKWKNYYGEFDEFRPIKEGDVLQPAGPLARCLCDGDGSNDSSGLRSGDANISHVAPYAQVNVGITHEFQGWNMKPLTLRFDGVNVFDTLYQIRRGTGIGMFAPLYGPRRRSFCRAGAEISMGCQAKVKLKIRYKMSYDADAWAEGGSSACFAAHDRQTRRIAP